jgi:hypothetical protein
MPEMLGAKIGTMRDVMKGVASSIGDLEPLGLPRPSMSVSDPRKSDKAAIFAEVQFADSMVGGPVAGATPPKRGRDHDGRLEASDCTALHRSRMFNWKPAAVVAISACPGAPMLAVGYETGDLELYEMNMMACIQVRMAPK